MKTLQKHSLFQFDGLYNFRDVGGFKTADGNVMKTGVLFRSADLSRLSRKDIETFRQLGIKSIIDLRTPREQNSKSSRITPQHGIQVIDVSLHDSSQQFTHLEFFKFLVSQASTIDFEQIMKDMYQNMAFNSHAQLNQIITHLSEQRNVPALIHCTGGKDRTGFISAVIQLLVGVPYENVLEDYLFSNDLIAPRMKKIQTFIRWMSLFQVSPDRLKPMLEVRREYLEEVCLGILDRYGDMKTYLCQACSIEPDRLVKLKQLLLE
ncbi:tyrosine-protein phosphatase [Brevibacillus borstelensis]|uniref:tyrosine-protein phosphatase n=1 Tax=Brevibacillus borstelensis TaxID=45462 RepID=UPI0030BB9FCC